MAKMRYKNFIWPNNPETYTLTCEHLTAVHKMPLGDFAVQDLGKTATVLRGEGAFFGKNAYAQFRALEAVFAERGSGTLLHPVWSGHNVYFTKLTLSEQPREDYVAYSFAFCEEGTQTDTQTAASGDAAQYYTVSAGETAWGICRRFGLSMTEFLRLNPKLSRPNLLQGGEEVRVG